MSYAVLEEFVYSLRRDLVSSPIPLSDANEGLVSHWMTIPSGARRFPADSLDRMPAPTQELALRETIPPQSRL
jgi:hypothetical protein